MEEEEKEEYQEEEETRKLDAQRQYVVIGSLALLFLFGLLFFVIFCCQQGSGPEGGDVQVDLGGFLCFHIVMFPHSSLLMYRCCNFDQEGRQVGSIQS